MRIDINAGGLGVFMDGVSMFSNPSNINSSSNHLIRTLNTVVNRTGNITGGVGALEEARQSLKSRIRTEENRQAATRTVWIKANAFVDTARSVDHRVAEMMRRETESFFVNNPTLRPPNIAGRAGRNLSRFWDSTRDVVASAWNGVVEWYTTNPWAKWMIGAAGISAFPMAARVVQRMASEADFENFLLMHAMGANAAGQVASVVAGGVLLALMGHAETFG